MDNKTIIFTLQDDCFSRMVRIYSDYKAVDENDNSRYVAQQMVMHWMCKLSAKYNDRGYAVLFEAD